ncbi:MAG: hypothetical protein K8T91_25915 [Planctomycetes bacterium]|nr:hypothetical protein [Planctomycetota bacterium]
MTSEINIVESLEAAIHILRPTDEVFRFCQDAEKLSTVVRHLQLIAPMEEGRTRWMVEGLQGTQIHWDAEMVCQQDSELLAFRSLPGSDIEISGAADFEAGPDGHGTVLTLKLKLALPHSSPSAAILELLGVGLEQMLDDDLQRIKEFLEADAAGSASNSSHSLHHG